MESTEKKKACTCTTPTTAQPVIRGYRGQLACTKCGGIFTWPLPEKQYEGDDPVEELLFNMGRDKTGLTVETALLTMLLRVEAQIKNLTGEAKAKKR